MSTSGDLTVKHIRLAVFFSAFLLLFGAVYQLFSHGVYSLHMICAFLIPAVMCVIPCVILRRRHRFPGSAFLRLWSAAAFTLGIGCAVQGILDIYGTTNALVILYPAAGGILAAAALICLILHRRRIRGRKASATGFSA